MLASGPPVVASAVSAGPPASLSRYVLAVAITVVAILSQYFVPQLITATDPVYGSLVGDTLVVYGIPILAFAALVGWVPLRNYAQGMGRATSRGIAWFGVMTVVALGVTLVLTIVYAIFDPGVIQLLNRPNPALEQAAGDPWLYIGFSFVVGFCEETIFRGWIYGYWRTRPGNWLVPATWTSALFAAMHLYYGTTYGAASPLIFPTLFFTGFAFAAAMRSSGGNVVVIALLHGVTDAISFYSLISMPLSLALHYLLILAGLIVAVLIVISQRKPPAEGTAPWTPPAAIVGDPYAAWRGSAWPPPPPPPAPPPPEAGG